MTAVSSSAEKRSAAQRAEAHEVARETRRVARAEERGRREAVRGRLLRAARASIRWMPLGVASALGELVGNLVWHTARALRRQTLRNLELALGAEKTPRERKRIGRRSFALAGRGLFAWMVLHRMGPDRALRYVTHAFSPESEELARSKAGFVLITQHAGLFDLGGAYLSREIGMVAVGRDASDAATSLLIKMRRDMGLRTIEQGSPRELLRALKEGGRVVMLIDQDIRRVNGAFVPFFGRPTHTPLGPATMAVRLGIPVVVVRTEWRTGKTHVVRMGEVLRADPELKGEDAVLDLTARCSAAVERSIRELPEEWLWVHDRWRTSPADRPDASIWPRPAAAAAPPEGPRP